MSFLNSIDVSSSGLSAQRKRMDTISENIANSNTTRTEDGGPYKKKKVIVKENKDFASVLNDKMSGVKVDSIYEDGSAVKREYDPSHPDADEEGYVLKPDINVVEEMTNMISTSRSYEANVTAMNAVKSMAMKAINIGR